MLLYPTSCIHIIAIEKRFPGSRVLVSFCNDLLSSTNLLGARFKRGKYSISLLLLFDLTRSKMGLNPGEIINYVDRMICHFHGNHHRKTTIIAFSDPKIRFSCSGTRETYDERWIMRNFCGGEHHPAFFQEGI